MADEMNDTHEATLPAPHHASIVNSTMWYRDAPLGAGGADVPDWSPPAPSVARTRIS